VGDVRRTGTRATARRDATTDEDRIATGAPQLDAQSRRRRARKDLTLRQPTIIDLEKSIVAVRLLSSHAKVPFLRRLTG
jgi:hypothetical protein